jgi:hypothetical protein
MLVTQVKCVITMSEMCRRLETEEEKVLPFYVSSLTQEEQEDVETAIQEPPYEKLALVGIYVLKIWDGIIIGERGVK